MFYVTYLITRSQTDVELLLSILPTELYKYCFCRTRRLLYTISNLY